MKTLTKATRRLIAVLLIMTVACTGWGLQSDVTRADAVWAAEAEFEDGLQPVAVASLDDITYKEDAPKAADSLAAADSSKYGRFANVKARQKLRRSTLTDQEKMVYDTLAQRIKLVAEGEETSAVVTIPLSMYGIQTSYSAADLGLESIFDPADQSKISEAARKAVNDRFQVSLYRILGAILGDMPYDLYWYDKTQGIGVEMPDIGAMDNGRGGYIVFEKNPVTVYSMRVSPEYGSGCETDADKTKAASASAQYAGSIVRENADKSDIEKLQAYRQAVTDLVDYDYDAAENYEYTGIYGNPWQVIYVFDQDPETKVVCEGYAKAFQYLCDLSDFDGNIVCNSVSGELLFGVGSGPHMWNIVSIEGNNYLVDLTNADSDDADKNDMLFLAGPEGSMDEGYYVVLDDSEETYDYVGYVYDEESLQYYAEDELTLSTLSYQESLDPEAAAAARKLAQDKKAAAAADKKIRAIGEPVTADSEAAVQAARQAYDALTADQQKLVTELQKLLAAEDDLSIIKDGGIRVTFRLVGGDGGEPLQEETWIEKKEYTVASESNVFQLFRKALSAEGLSWTYGKSARWEYVTGLDAPDGTYIAGIRKADSSVTLEEFQYGSQSGWIYTINGKMANLGVSDQILRDGDDIEFRYTTTYEPGDGPSYDAAMKKFKVKAGKKKFTATWRKVSGVSGYEIRYSLDKDMTDAKVKTVKASKKKLVVKKLKKKKYYYIQARPYKIIDGQKCYGTYTAVKRIKTR
ncbi:MAG: DUF4430 domain-containing protein [Bacillota bacterium]|nr:DUF4430 domain-containing protein [Bacillota bacterium]